MRFSLFPFFSSSSSSKKERRLWEACSSGNLPLAGELSSKRRVNINWQDPEQGRTAFYRACGNGHLPLVKLLLSHAQINVNLATNEGDSPFLIACFQGHLEIVKEAASQRTVEKGEPGAFGAEQAAPEVAGRRLLGQYGEGDRYFGVARQLARDLRVDVNQPKRDGSTPLLIACQFGLEEIVSFLLAEPRVDPNRPLSAINHTPLFVATLANHVGVVKLLLGSGREIDTWQVSAQFGVTAAEQARAMGHLEIAQLIEAYQKDPDYVILSLRHEFGIVDKNAADIFALMAMHSDGFFNLCD